MNTQEELKIALRRISRRTSSSIEHRLTGAQTGCDEPFGAVRVMFPLTSLRSGRRMILPDTGASPPETVKRKRESSPRSLSTKEIGMTNLFYPHRRPRPSAAFLLSPVRRQTDKPLRLDEAQGTSNWTTEQDGSIGKNESVHERS